MTDYVVTFSANLYVRVEADSEDEAREKAGEIASETEFQYTWAADHADFGDPVVVIHSDDVVSVEEAE